MLDSHNLTLLNVEIQMTLLWPFHRLSRSCSRTSQDSTIIFITYFTTDVCDVREVSLIFDIWHSTKLHHGPCASNATDIVAETQTAGDKLSRRPWPTPYFHFQYREKRRQFVTAWVNGKSRRSLPLSSKCDPRFHFRNTSCREQTFQPTTTNVIVANR